MTARPWLLLHLAACSPVHLDEALPELPLLDPDAGFDAWDELPPPPLSACAGFAALRGGIQYTSYRDAMADAVSGDTVWVCPGTHYETSDYLPPGNYVVAGVDRTPGAVVFDLTGQTGSVVRASYTAGVSVQVRDLTFVESNGVGGPISVSNIDAVDLRRLRFLDAQSGHTASINNTPVVRARDLEVTGGHGDILTLRCQFLTSHTGPECEARIWDVTVRDRGFSDIDLVGEGPPVSTSRSAQLHLEWDGLQMENIVSDQIPISVAGFSYDVELRNVRIRNIEVPLRLGPSGTCWHGKLINITNWSSIRGGFFRMKDFEITDTIAASVFAYASGGSLVPATPRDFRTQLVNGIFHRNNTCYGTIDNVPPTNTIRIENVDFGNGINDNTPRDWNGLVSYAGTPCGESFHGAATYFGYYVTSGASQCWY